jgi:hypothetical protein
MPRCLPIEISGPCLSCIFTRSAPLGLCETSATARRWRPGAEIADHRHRRLLRGIRTVTAVLLAIEKLAGRLPHLLEVKRTCRERQRRIDPTRLDPKPTSEPLDCCCAN